MYRKGRQDASELGETQQGKGRGRASCLPGRGRKRDRGILVLVLCAMYVIWTRMNLHMGSAVVLTRQKEAAPVVEVGVESTHPNKLPLAEKRKDESGECRADAFLNDYAYAEFETTAGSFSLMLRPDLAPHGAQHLVSLVRAGFYLGGRVPFLYNNEWAVMFGAAEKEEQFKKLREFPNDLNTRKDTNPCPKNKIWDRGVVAMMGGPHIMIVKNPADGMGKNENDAPAGYITSGADTINKLFSYDRKKQLEAGERWEKVQEPGGADYLKANFPDLDYILFAQVGGDLSWYFAAGGI